MVFTLHNIERVPFISITNPNNLPLTMVITIVNHHSSPSLIPMAMTNNLPLFIINVLSPENDSPCSAFSVSSLINGLARFSAADAVACHQTTAVWSHGRVPVESHENAGFVGGKRGQIMDFFWRIRGLSRTMNNFHRETMKHVKTWSVISPTQLTLDMDF